MGIIPLIDSGKINNMAGLKKDKDIKPILVGTNPNKINKKIKKANVQKQNLSMKSKNYKNKRVNSMKKNINSFKNCNSLNNIYEPDIF